MRAAVFAIVCGFAVLTLPDLVGYALFGEPLPTALELALPMAWIPAEAGMFTLSLRWADRRGMPLPWNLALAYVTAAVSGVAILVIYEVALARFPDLGEPATHGVSEAGASGAFAGLLVLGLWVMFFVTPRLVATARTVERERQELLREAERAHVRSVLEPHFVLNTLNAIAGVVGREPETARSLIGDLGDLLRDATREDASAPRAVADEVRWLRRYAHVLEVRHRDRLEVQWDVDPQAMQHAIPVLLLQPLLENAIQHGALAVGGGGHVDVKIASVDGGVECTIRDDGPGFATGASHGRGLEIVRRRLSCEVDRGALSVVSSTSGTTVKVTLGDVR